MSDDDKYWCKLGESGDFVLFILFLVANAVPSTQWVQDKYLLKEGNYTVRNYEQI